MRVALTIILNGKHHLEHNDYASRLLDIVDLWCIVEGASLSTGSTSWCKQMPPWSHNNGRSVDGTIECVKELAAKSDKLLFVEGSGFWTNKDAQVNAGINKIREKVQRAFLWEIDCDEQWTREQMDSAEKDLVAHGAKTGQFLADYWIGKRLMAKGEWGEGNGMPYNRLWNWHGELFANHEPPQLVGGNGKQVVLPQRFQHYAYYFEQDVKFKDAWYGGHEHIHQRWLRLQSEAERGGRFPRHIRELITGHFGKSNTTIVKV